MLNDTLKREGIKRNIEERIRSVSNMHGPTKMLEDASTHHLVDFVAKKKDGKTAFDTM